MPELPEVETVTRLIRPQLEGRRIVGADVQWLRTLGGPSRAVFERAVTGCTVKHVRRRAKHILFDLARGREPAGALAVHLRMTGRLFVAGLAAPRDAYARVTLDLHDDTRLVFVDVRKFGRFRFVPDAAAFTAGLGPEPLEAAFTPEWLYTALRARRRMLKPLLLDQTFLAGLGNIYVDECLHRARLHPERSAQTVTQAQASALHGAIRSVLAAAIERQGSSFDKFYRTPEGQPGSYQHEFRVYGRAGQPCPACGASIRRFVVGQRGTHACLRCQRPPRRSD
ncbi:MAG: bifunctional DNA-formamidopyrimidine glycosylase/DNA-(apurinic or apyrimidinic site) lyase [Planctomycetota bacterium]|nr:bifunctional DNA-formamidopyrimidine glycosylase/DNA-(apurinic or apyrimidinic site) lyase [Planctomycetota bacterium]